MAQEKLQENKGIILARGIYERAEMALGVKWNCLDIWI